MFARLDAVYEEYQTLVTPRNRLITGSKWKKQRRKREFPCEQSGGPFFFGDRKLQDCQAVGDHANRRIWRTESRGRMHMVFRL